MSTLKYWLWLTTRKGLGTRSALQVLEWFGSPEGAFFADPAEYARIPDLSQTERSALENKNLAEPNTILGDCERLGIRILTYQDASYPERLRNIFDPPLVLYVKGKTIPFDERVAIGMVGTRECSPYGIKQGGKIAMELARSGAVVVSGIAEGIDTACIKGALSGGGTVVSVLGGGIDVYYPTCSRYLYDDVAAVGALISEYPPGTPPMGAHFPIRNRIISGLSLGVVVVESKMNGGSMHTVNHVADQSRDLFALPGPVDVETCRGTNSLIREGSARLVTCGWDILEEYVDRYPFAIHRPAPMTREAEESRLEQLASGAEEAKTAKTRPVRAESGKPKAKQEGGNAKAPEEDRVPWSKMRDKLTDDQRDILLALEARPLVADEVVELTQIPTRHVLSALTILQVQGYVTQEPGKRFRAQLKLKVE